MTESLLPFLRMPAEYNFDMMVIAFENRLVDESRLRMEEEFEKTMEREIREEWEFRQKNPLQSKFDFSFLEDMPFGNTYFGWQAAGWIWMFDTEWGDKILEPDARLINRLQDIFGCANVSYGPSFGPRRDGKVHPGVWARKVDFQKRRHRPKLCYCRHASYENGTIYEGQ